MLFADISENCFLTFTDYIIGAFGASEKVYLNEQLAVCSICTTVSHSRLFDNVKPPLYMRCAKEVFII